MPLTRAFIPPLPLLSTRPHPLTRPHRRALRPHLARHHRIVSCQEQPTPEPSFSADSLPPPLPSPVSISTAASSAPNLNAALADAASRALANLTPGGPPTLAFLFVSVRYAVSNVGTTGRHSLDLAVPRLRGLVPELQAVIGCTTDGVIGAGSMGVVAELENVPAVSLTLARLPGISVSTFHVMPDDLPTLDDPPARWSKLVGNPARGAGFIVLSDPSFAECGELNRFLAGMNYAFPGSPVVGSLASVAAAFPNGHMFCTLPRDVLSLESTSLRDNGLVGISLTGNVQLDVLVSSGCRSIGPLFEVAKVAGSAIVEMHRVGRPSTTLSALGCLKSIISYATLEEKRLIENDLYVGIALDNVVESVDSSTDASDNFLITRVNATAMVDDTVTLATGVRPGQRVQFFIKERESAQKALDDTLQKYKRAELANTLVGYGNAPVGAFVFVDAGRGRALFREPAMETRNLASFASGVPIAGVFGAGQIGPCRTGAVDEPAVLHNAANLIALVRRRSGMDPVQETQAGESTAS